MNVVSVTLDINSIKTKEERNGAVTRRQSLLRILCFANTAVDNSTVKNLYLISLERR